MITILRQNDLLSGPLYSIVHTVCRKLSVQKMKYWSFDATQASQLSDNIIVWLCVFSGLVDV